MRQIKLKHDEIELIKTALQYVYDKKLDILADSRKILSEEEKELIMNRAGKYYDVLELFDGQRDF
mgnify:CR=1 FL=1